MLESKNKYLILGKVFSPGLDTGNSLQISPSSCVRDNHLLQLKCNSSLVCLSSIHSQKLDNLNQLYVRYNSNFSLLKSPLIYLLCVTQNSNSAVSGLSFSAMTMYTLLQAKAFLHFLRTHNTIDNSMKYSSAFELQLWPT